MGQPAELARLPMISRRARWRAEGRAPPATLRELIPACVIVGIPCGLVVLQPDLGSAIVFIAIMFAMLYWAGTKPSLLLLLGSPVIGLVLAFSTAAWGAWIILLFGLLLWWRPYVWEGLTVMLANIVMGIIDRKSTRLNSSHSQISYAVFCLKKKKKETEKMKYDNTV